MLNRLVFAVLAFALLVPIMNANAEPSKSKESIAVSFAENLAAGKLAECEAMFDATMKNALPGPKLKAVWDQVVGRAGAYKHHLPATTENHGAALVVHVPAVFASETIDLNIAFANSNQIAGFFIAPHASAYKEPPYAHAGLYADVPTKVGAGKWELDGTVSVPKGNGPFPAVILVHGSGANDQDESLGQNKPFRDLAHGLASKGILVLRYNKRTHQHEKQFLANPQKDFTVKDEVLDDVLAAAQVLRGRPDVDKQNLFLLTHSFSGMLIPRLVAQDAEIKGVISFAGSNVPLEDAILSQVAYIRTVQPHMPANEGLRHAAEKIKALQDKDAGSDVTLLGAHPAYWLDLRRHDPLVEIKSTNKPMLFLQGGRDYQVTADGDFANWQNALKGSSASATFKLYPDLNHFFVTGKGKATPEEYLVKSGNVDSRVVADIADWVLSLSRPAK